MKRILMLFVAICVMLSCMPAPVFASTVIGGNFSDNNGNEFTWSLDTATGAFALGGTGSMTLKENPYTAGQLPWVNYEGTDYRKQIKTVTIGSGITRLGRQLFEECTSIKEVTIPGTVTHTGWGVFNICTSLERATFEEGFLDLQDKVFRNCISLTELNLPKSTKVIRQNVVQGCKSLKTLTIPGGLTMLHQNAFGDNKGGEDGTAVSPAPDENIGHSIDFTVYNKTIGEEYMTAYYPDSIANVIDEPQASGDFGVDNEGNESGLEWAVYGTALYVSRKIDDNGAFVGSGKMPDFTAGKATPWAERYRTTLTKAVFENGVICIGERCLEEHTALTTVTMANTVTVMGAFAMNASSKVASVKLSDNLTTLAVGVFNNNLALKELIIPYGTSVNADSFRKVCDQLVLKVYMGSEAYQWATGEGSSVGKTPVVRDKDYGLSYEVFDFLGGYVSDDGSVIWKLDEGVLTIQGKGEIPDYTATAELPWASYRSQITSAVIADGITRIGNRAFQECHTMTSIEIADSVIYIGEYVFNGCSKLESVKLSANTGKIMNGTFNNTPALMELTIPSKTAVEASSFTKTSTNIKINVYAGSKAHEIFGDDLTISGVLEIGSTTTDKVYADRICTLLMTETGTDNDTAWTWDYATKTVTIGGTGSMTSWHTISNQKTSDTWYAKRGWHGYAGVAEKVVIGNGVTAIGDYAFMQFTKLKEVEFENNSSLNEIGAFAFSNTIITEVTIPESVQTVVNYAFRASSKTDTTTHTLRKFVVLGNDTEISDAALSRQSQVTVYCNVGSKAAEYALKTSADYRLMDTEYSIEDYSKGAGVASILNSTENEKDASVVFVNYLNNEVTDISIIDTTLAAGMNDIAPAKDFAQSGVGNVAIYLWSDVQNIKPLAKPYMKTTVWMLGDSIMSDWVDARYPQEGWGEAFKNVVTSDITINNRAIPGYTAESCYNKIWSTNAANYDNGSTRNWTPVRDEIAEGDYVIISYLHNDYCTTADPSKAKYKDTKYINTYREYMAKIVDECLERGIHIILAVPPNKGVKYNYHNQPIDGVDVGDYSAVIPALAEEKGVPCVNIHKWTMEETAKDEKFLDTIYLTKTYLNGLVASGDVTEEILNNHSNTAIKNKREDVTHPSVLGCKNIAEFVASQLKTMNTGLEIFLK